MTEQRRPQTSESFNQLLLTSARSTGFWSVIAAAVGVVAIFAGGIAYLLIDEISNFAVSVLIIGIVLVFLALVLSPRAVAIFVVGRRGRYGFNMAIMAAAFLVIVVLVNFLLFRNATRFDVTATRALTLATRTQDLLKNDLDTRDKHIRANAFFAPTDVNAAIVRQLAEDLLNEFERQTTRFSYRFIDPDFNRGLALQYGVKRPPVIVFEDVATGKQQAINVMSEENFVTGVLIVTGIEQKKVYFLTGHNERSITRDPATGVIDDEGFDSAFVGMQRDNYDVRGLNLKQSEIKRVPDDAALLVIPGPTQDLDDDEKAALTDYILGGGRILALFDPAIPGPDSDSDNGTNRAGSGIPPTFSELLGQWGIKVGSHRVADLVSNIGGEVLTPLIQRANSQYRPNDDTQITDQLDNTFFPEATSIETVLPLEDMPPFIRFIPLAFTTPLSWLETDPEEVSFDQGVEQIGSVVVAAAFEVSGTVDETQRHPTAKLVIFSDSDFAKNRWFFSTENSDFFLNSVNWLAGDLDLSGIRKPPFPTRTLFVNTRERDFIKWSSWLFPPFVMFVLGVVVWWRRR